MKMDRGIKGKVLTQKHSYHMLIRFTFQGAKWETNMKFLASVMKENSFLKGIAAVFVLKNTEIKIQTNLNHCRAGH